MDLNTFLWKFILTAVAFQTVFGLLPQRFVPPDGSGNITPTKRKKILQLENLKVVS